MAEKVGEIYYVIEAHTQKILDSLRPANASIDELGKKFGQSEVAGKRFEFQMKKTSAEIKKMGSEGDLASSQLKSLKMVLGGIFAFQSAKGVLDLVENYNEMADRVQLATSSFEEYEYVQQRMLRTANATERNLSEAQELYLGTADALKEMGYSTSEVIDVGDSLSHSFAANAASADVAKSAISALSKAMVTGRVNAMQWISVEAAAPTIIADIATATGKTTAEIRRMGAEGKISTKVLADGLILAKDKNRELDESMSQTVAGSMTKVINSFSVFFGELNRSTGATQLITQALTGFADNIDAVAIGLSLTVSAAIGRYIALTGQSIVASMSAAMAARAKALEDLKVAQANEVAAATALKHATANKALGGSHAAAAVAARNHAAAATALGAAQQAVVSVGSRLLGVLGGPIGIVAMLVSAGAAMLTLGRNTKEAKHDVDLLTGSIDKLGDANLRLLKIRLTEKIDEMKSLGGEAAKSTARIETLNKNLQETSKSNPNHSIWQREIDELQATVESATAEIGAYEEQLAKVEALEKKMAAGSSEAYRDPDAERRLKDMRDELELAKLTGEAKERLRAIQRLGDNASPEQKQEAADLAVQIHRYEEARKKATEATKEGVKAAKRDAEEAKKNAEAVKTLEQELRLAGLSGLALAEAKALAGLNEFAAPEEIERIKFLTGAIHELEEAERNRQLLSETDPFAAEVMRYEGQLDNLRRLNEAKLIEDQRYLDLKTQAEKEHAETLRTISEENFRAQSKQNELLMASIDAFGSSASSALSGLLVGMHSGTDAARMLGNAVLNEVVGSFVQMGIAQVKAWVMGRAAQSAAAAGYLASVTGQVKANTALAAQAAFASTAAIPIVGPGLAPAAAATAATAAGALGAPAIAGASASVAGGRQYGGPVAAGKMYRINENGAPEVYNAANGQQFLLPNTRGEVVSNKEAVRSSAQSSPRITVNLIEDASRGGQVEQSIGAENEQVITAFVADIRGGGQASQALEATYGLRRQGR